MCVNVRVILIVKTETGFELKLSIVIIKWLIT